MALDINATLDSALDNAKTIETKQAALVASNEDLQKRVRDLQTQIDNGVLSEEHEKKLQDLVVFLGQLSK